MTAFDMIKRRIKFEVNFKFHNASLFFFFFLYDLVSSVITRDMNSRSLHTGYAIDLF